MEPSFFYKQLNLHNLNFFTGVPDSLLKDFCACISDKTDKIFNITAANEGNAIALAASYYLATGKSGIVFMQNSGLGNCINPLTSLTNSETYSIPFLMLIGWRGEPGTKDEPQHIEPGKLTLDFLNTLGIPYSILPTTEEEVIEVIKKAVSYMNKNLSPYALVVRKETFDKYEIQNEKIKQGKQITDFPLNREYAIQLITSLLQDRDIIVSTTGKTSRELFEYRATNNQGHHQDFLTVGSMGHSSSIALGIALQKPARNVYCFDGDGAFIMHMGSLATIGYYQPRNFKHVVINNFSHDSVGGQPTAAEAINIPLIAEACGYKIVFSAETADEIITRMKELQSVEGPALLEIRVKKGARKELGRPTRTPSQNKKDFMCHLMS
jgi:phosphonopyruvate decarboxylase